MVSVFFVMKFFLVGKQAVFCDSQEFILGKAIRKLPFFDVAFDNLRPKRTSVRRLFHNENRNDNRKSLATDYYYLCIMTLRNKTTTRNNTTFVIRQGQWSPDPVRMVLQAKTDPNIENLHLMGIAFNEEMIATLTELFQSRYFSFVYINQCCAVSLDCRRLARVLVKQVKDLLVDETVDLLDALLENNFYMRSLTIRLRRQGLTDTQCLLLGKRLANSPDLKELSLKGTDIHAPALLAPGIATSYHLEKLVLSSSLCASSIRSQQQGLADLVVSLDGQYGIGAVVRLLKSPASHLKVLDLSNLHLLDGHAKIITHALTTNSTLEQLNLSFNEIGCSGIDSIAEDLRHIQHLRKLSLKPNPWVRGQALLDGMKENLSIEYLDSLWLIPQAPMLRYYAIINRGGRRVLRSPHSISPGLWPLVLERAGKVIYGVTNERQAKLNALYYLLKNGPVLFQR